MKAEQELSLAHHFAELTDPRIDRSRLHEPRDIVAIALCAVVAGADSWDDIEDFGKVKYDWLKTFLDLPNGIPSLVLRPWVHTPSPTGVLRGETAHGAVSRQPPSGTGRPATPSGSGTRSSRSRTRPTGPWRSQPAPRVPSRPVPSSTSDAGSGTGDSSKTVPRPLAPPRLVVLKRLPCASRAKAACGKAPLASSKEARAVMVELPAASSHTMPTPLAPPWFAVPKRLPCASCTRPAPKYGLTTGPACFNGSYESFRTFVGTHPDRLVRRADPRFGYCPPARSNQSMSE